MANKVKYNLKNVHAAKLTRTEDGGYSYETPRAIPGAVSISLDAEGDTSPFYMDFIYLFIDSSVSRKVIRAGNQITDKRRIGTFSFCKMVICKRNAHFL